MNKTPNKLLLALAGAAVFLGGDFLALGAESAYSSDEFVASEGYATFAVNNLWICIAAALVFIMHLGFASLESGLTQAKNCVNILFKNVWIISTGLYSLNTQCPQLQMHVQWSTCSSVNMKPQ